MASRELGHEKRADLHREAQAIAADNVPVIYTAQSGRLAAVRNVFSSTTLYALWDVGYLYCTD